MTPLGNALKRIYVTSGHASLRDWCAHVGVPYETLRRWMREDEPAWLRTLRTIKRRTRMSWDEILDGRTRTARRVTTCDGAVGHCGCSACGGAIDQDDAWCRHCGRRLEGE